MKNIFNVLAVVSVLLFASSCTKDPIEVNYQIDDTQICLNANPNWGPEQYYVITITKADIEAALAASGTGLDADKLESAKLGNATLEMETNGITFDEVSNAALYIRESQTGAVDASNKGTQIAYTENIGAGVTQITMKLNGTELKSYLLMDEFQLVAEVLNANKVGGTPDFCFKLTSGTIKITVKQD